MDPLLASAAALRNRLHSGVERILPLHVYLAPIASSCSVVYGSEGGRVSRSVFFLPRRTWWHSMAPTTCVVSSGKALQFKRWKKNTSGIFTEVFRVVEESTSHLITYFCVLWLSPAALYLPPGPGGILLPFRFQPVTNQRACQDSLHYTETFSSGVNWKNAARHWWLKKQPSHQMN